MILQALNDYYQRLAKENLAPPLGFSLEKVGFILVLNEDGDLIQDQDIRDVVGKKSIPKLLPIPYTNEVNVRSSNIQPNFLADKAEYVLGMDQSTKRLKGKHDAYKKLFKMVTDGEPDKGIIAVSKFLNKWSSGQLPRLKYKEQIDKNDAGFVSFRLENELSYIHERPAVKKVWAKYLATNKPGLTGNCLVTGNLGNIQNLHAQFGIPGGQPSGVSLVSFNDFAYESYGKKKGANCPVSVEAEFNYSTALKYLLRFENRRRIRIGDTTTVFWTEKTSIPPPSFGRKRPHPWNHSWDTC